MDWSKSLGFIGRRGSRRSGIGTLIAGAVIGIGAAMLLDPAAGRRRRGLLRDKATHYRRVLTRRQQAVRHNLEQRAKGRRMAALAAQQEGPVDDERLVQRVRSTMGRHVRHVHPILVQAEGGVVTLSGPILAREVPELIASVRAVRGVREVRNALDVHIIADIPALRGDQQRASS